MFFFPLWPISVWILFCFLQLTELCQSFYHVLWDFHMHLWNWLKDEQLTIFYVLCSSRWPLDCPPAACTAPKWKGSRFWLSCSSSLAQGAYNRSFQFFCKLLSISCDCTQSTGTAKVVNISVLTRSSACYQGYVCVVLSHPNLQTFINTPIFYCVTM